MDDKLISDTLVNEIWSCLESKIDIPNEYINAFIARTMLAVQKEDRKQISSLYPKLCDSVSLYFRGHQYNEEYLSASKEINEFIVDMRPNNRGFVFKMGQLHACTTILNDMIRKLDEQETVITNIAYFEKNIVFFEAIASMPGIKHSKLAAILGKSPSSLSQFVSKIQQYDFFTQTVVGREKYYRLTNKGTRLLDQLEIESSKKSNDSANISKPEIANIQFDENNESSEFYASDEFACLYNESSIQKHMCLTLATYSAHLTNQDITNQDRSPDNLVSKFADILKEQEKTYKTDTSILQKYD